jgi:hypothetical protein
MWALSRPDPNGGRNQLPRGRAAPDGTGRCCGGLNLCHVKLRDQGRLERLGYVEEYPQYPNGKFGDACQMD